MQKKAVIKALRYCILGFVLLTVILFVLGLYNLLIGLVGAISGDSFHLRLDKSDAPNDWTITLDANPRNNGFLGMSLFLHLGILNSTGEYIAVNSTSVYIAPGGQSPFSVVLTIPYEEVLRYNITEEEGAPVVFEMMFGIRTLGDLVGFMQTMRIPGEVEL